MLRALDARRDQKIEVEQVALRYKLKALQLKTVGERSQIHGQYFQTARAIREKKMEDVGALWYQIQRDRRNWNGSPPGRFSFDPFTCDMINERDGADSLLCRRLHVQIPHSTLPATNAASFVQFGSFNPLRNRQTCWFPCRAHN